MAELDQIIFLRMYGRLPSSSEVVKVISAILHTEDLWKAFTIADIIFLQIEPK